MPDTAGLVIGSTFLVATAAFVWLIWTRYLHHKELMKLIEAGDRGEPVAEANERWRLRLGLLSGVVLIVLGCWILALFPAARNMFPCVREPEYSVLLVGGAVVSLGVVVVVAYRAWARQGRGASSNDGE